MLNCILVKLFIYLKLKIKYSYKNKNKYINYKKSCPITDSGSFVYRSKQGHVTIIYCYYYFRFN